MKAMMTVPQSCRWLAQQRRYREHPGKMGRQADVVIPWPLSVCEGVTVLPKTRPICADYPALEVQR